MQFFLKLLFAAIVLFFMSIVSTHAAFVNQGDSLYFSFDESDLVYTGETDDIYVGMQIDFAFQLPQIVLNEVTGEWSVIEPNFSDREKFYPNEIAELSVYENIDSVIPSSTELRNGSECGTLINIYSLQYNQILIDGDGNASTYTKYPWMDLNGAFNIKMISGDALITKVGILLNDGTSSYTMDFEVNSVPIPSANVLFGAGLICVVGLRRR